MKKLWFLVCFGFYSSVFAAPFQLENRIVLTGIGKNNPKPVLICNGSSEISLRFLSQVQLDQWKLLTFRPPYKLTLIGTINEKMEFMVVGVDQFDSLRGNHPSALNALRYEALSSWLPVTGMILFDKSDMHVLQHFENLETQIKTSLDQNFLSLILLIAKLAQTNISELQKSHFQRILSEAVSYTQKRVDTANDFLGCSTLLKIGPL